MNKYQKDLQFATNKLPGKWKRFLTATISLLSFRTLPEHSLYYLWNIVSSKWKVQKRMSEKRMEIVRGKELQGKRGWRINLHQFVCCLLAPLSIRSSSVHPDSCSHCLTAKGLWPIITWSLSLWGSFKFSISASTLSFTPIHLPYNFIPYMYILLYL